MKNIMCKGCEYCGSAYAQDGFNFLTCKFPPYKGKWIAEIANCPKHADGTKYKSKKAFVFGQLKVNKGDIYKVKIVERPNGYVDYAIHLEDDSGNWIELIPELLTAYFEATI